jgi:methionine synthase II (cobalamin-independent)
MRTTLVGSWPPEARYRADLARYHRGELDDRAAEQLLIDVATVAIAQQRACGVDEMTGGETSADSFILHFPRVLSGIVASEDTAAWDGRGTFRIVGPIGAPQGLGIAAAFGRERGIDPHLDKVTIPGPSELTTMLEPRGAARAAWPAVIDLIRAEIRALVDMGARETSSSTCPRSPWGSPMAAGTPPGPSRRLPPCSTACTASGEACTCATATLVRGHGHAIASSDR